MNKLQILNLAERCSYVWSSFKLPPDTEALVDTWHSYLGTIPEEDVRKAMNTFKRAKFMPSLSEILAAVEHLGDPSDNEATTQARAYWNYRDQMQFSNGSGYKPELKAEIHPEVRSVMDAVGFGEGWETRFRFAWRDR